MVTLLYDVVFGYIGSFFFKEHYAIKRKEIADIKIMRQYDVGVGLLQRLSHPKFRHPV